MPFEGRIRGKGLLCGTLIEVAFDQIDRLLWPISFLMRKGDPA
jgi:hypothetical protein